MFVNKKIQAHRSSSSSLVSWKISFSFLSVGGVLQDYADGGSHSSLNVYS